jgi:hypothetical protein
MILLVLASCGCSMLPEGTLPPSKIGADQYESMRCEELRTESKRLLTVAMDHLPQGSPPEDDQRQKDLALISRDMDALNKLWTSKKC